MVHFLEQQEVLANLVRKVYVLVVDLQIVLVDYVPLPNSLVLGKFHHLLSPSEELELVFRDVGELKFVFDEASIDKGRLLLEV